MPIKQHPYFFCKLIFRDGLFNIRQEALGSSEMFLRLTTLMFREDALSPCLEYRLRLHGLHVDVSAF